MQLYQNIQDVNQLMKNTQFEKGIRNQLKTCNTLEAKYQILASAYIPKHNHYLSVHELKKLQMNFQTKEELACVSMEKLETLLEEKLVQYETQIGRKKRSDRRTFIKKLMLIFYDFCKTSLSGHVMPAMETLAYHIEPSLEHPNAKDSSIVAKIKSNTLTRVKMRISRTVKDLEEMGLIKTFGYYTSKEHFLNGKNHKAFMYHLMPLTEVYHIKLYKQVMIVKNKGLGALFNSLIQITTKESAIIKQMQKIRQRICRKIDDIYQVFTPASYILKYQEIDTAFYKRLGKLKGGPLYAQIA